MIDALYNYCQSEIHSAELSDEFNKLCIPFENSLSEEQIDVFHKILDCVSDTTAISSAKTTYRVLKFWVHCGIIIKKWGVVMNTIEIQTITISKGYKNECLFIDGTPLHEYLIKWYHQNGWGEIPQPTAPVDELALTLTAEFDFDGDARFMRTLMMKDIVNLPILSCPDDMDFSCIVIIAEVEKKGDVVYWKRIGQINHSLENFEEEKEHGIVFVDSYSDEDWKKYLDVAFLRVNSPEWCEWISVNWSEELFRRRINYTYPCYQNEKNIDWIYECNWCFDRNQYDTLMKSCIPHSFMDNDEK